MKAIVQRVAASSVSVDGETVGQIERGLMILIGVTHSDSEKEARWLANKIAGLRIFEDDQLKMNRSLLDVGGSALVVSQFTLYGDCRKGRRPSFTNAAPPDLAEPLCERFIDLLREAGVERVESGVFAAHMVVDIQNDGPVTLILEKHSTA
jgi:D-tyrosyl-tRNA(Tyr) deacylase